MPCTPRHLINNLSTMKNVKISTIYNCYLLLFFLLIFAMCQGKKDNRNSILSSTSKNNELIEINIDDLDDNTPILFSSVFKNFKLTPLETRNECLIGRISKMEVIDDTLYILDSNIAKSLFLFDREGKFIQKIGKIGKGPGEYIQPAFFSVNYKEKQILILDTKQQKIIRYASNGDFINEFKLEKDLLPIQIATQKDLIYIDQLNSKYMPSDYLLYALDKSGKIKTSWLSSMIYQLGFKHPVNNSFNFFTTTTDIKYVKPFFDTIFSISENQIKPYLHVHTTNKVTKQDMVEINGFNDTKQYLNFSKKYNKFLGITDYMESNRLVMFKFRNHAETHNLFYYHSSNEIFCTTKFIDDLTLAVHPSIFYCTYKNNFISCIQSATPNAIESFIANVAEKRIKMTEKEKFALNGIKATSNPIIVFYECRENFLRHE